MWSWQAAEGRASGREGVRWSASVRRRPTPGCRDARACGGKPLRPCLNHTRDLRIARANICRRATLHDWQRSYFVTCFAFVSLIQGYVPLLLKLGVCCRSLIRKCFPTERRPVNPQVPGSSPGRGAINSGSWQFLRSKIFAELFRKATRNNCTSELKQPRCALRQGAVVLACASPSGERVQHLYARLLEVARVSRHDDETMNECSCRDQAILDRQGLAGSAQAGKKFGPTKTR